MEIKATRAMFLRVQVQFLYVCTCMLKTYESELLLLLHKILFVLVLIPSITV